jgi:hypothetical protein
MAEQFDTPEQIGKQPDDVVRRWLLELDLYKRNTSKWRKDAERIQDIYRGKNRQANSFNILWANTELLRPAVYNSVPEPDCRRRFKDDDPIGKTVAEVLYRCLSFTVDQASFDAALKKSVLDMLLPCRGVVRVRYVPSLTPGVQDDSAVSREPTADEAMESESREELSFEQVVIDHVQWDDFAHGPGECWDDVGWIGFEHDMHRDELVEKFGDVGKQVPLNNAEFLSDDNGASEVLRELFNTAEVWEFWDKSSNKVIFIATSYKDGPLAVIDDPLGLEQFFPVPEPLFCIEDSSSLIPILLYCQYEEQAKELNQLNNRMNRIIEAIRVRGLYASDMMEIAQLMFADDNKLIPVQNWTALIDSGGLDKAIAWLPIDMLAAVLKELAEKAEHCKQVIYELTGIADIMRGASNPDETATAQNIKSQWGTGRLSRMQQNVQRFIRDLVRMAAEIIANRFQPETLLKMTGLQIPTMQQAQQQLMPVVQQQAMQYQQAVQMAMQTGQQPPPRPTPPEMPVVLEQVVQVLRDDALRQFKVDIETDSTIAAHQQVDMVALKDLTLSLNQTLAQLMPVVGAGLLPVEALKEILLAITRRARMGTAVEDAIEKIQQPPPPPPQQQQQPTKPSPEQQIQLEREKATIKAQLEQHKAELKAQTDLAAQESRVKADISIAAMQAKFDDEIQRLKFSMESQLSLLGHRLSQVQADRQHAQSMEQTAQDQSMQGADNAAI